MDGQVCQRSRFVETRRGGDVRKFVLGDFHVKIHFICAETVIVFARGVVDGATQLLSKLVTVFMVVLLERTSA